VSADEAARIATDGVNRLLASRRLVLVLDLDHTLLNTVRDCDLVGEERQRAQQQLQQQHAVLRCQHQQQQQQQVSSAGDGSSTPQADSVAAGEATTAAGKTAPNTNNSTNSSSSTSYSGNPWEPQPPNQQQQQLRPRLFHLADKGLWTKLRPGVESFLARVSQLYELHIYTMGDKGYAGLMADLLDPQHKLFVGRVISAVSLFGCVCVPVCQ
jgi:RNA polymerase II C-terminal domain phosphatase-like 3/4